jgi:catechol 2,3-dioxygenase-like lactoylglutathione lyase family enzyme
MQKFLHAGWEVPRWDETTRFYQDVLGFKPSDWIGDRVGFFRAGDRFHHSLVLIRSDRPAFNHFCIQVESLDDVMRFRNNALRDGVKLRDDLLRHAPSGSIGVYMSDEARGFAVEFCIGHPQLDDATHKARILPMAPETKDVWLSPLPGRTSTGVGQPSPSARTSSWLEPSTSAPPEPRPSPSATSVR